MEVSFRIRGKGNKKEEEIHMKKKGKKLATVLVVAILANVLGAISYAAPRAARITPELQISGSTVTCAVNVMGDSSSDSIC